MNALRRHRGFTMVELVCVLLILGILVVAGVTLLATPVFRSRTMEVRYALGVIASLEYQHRIETGAFVACPASPPEVPRGTTVRWEPAGGWARLGFEAGPENRFQYSVATGVREDGEVHEPYFVIRAQGDLDGDGQVSTFLLDSRDPRTVRIDAEDE